MVSGGANGDSAPTTTNSTATTMETVVIVRAIKVIGMLLAVLALFLSALCVAAGSWMEAYRVREGLWTQCFYRINSTTDVDCYPGNNTDWKMACQALFLLSMIITFIGAVVVSTGLRGDDPPTKVRLYISGAILFFVAAFFQVLGLIVYPAKFLEGIVDSAAAQWKFGWCYGLSWLAVILVIVGGVLLLIDRNFVEVEEREVIIKKENLEEEGEIIEEI